MSDYSNTLGGAAKDAANATILAADYDTQFDNLATMSATKANKVVSATNNNLISMDANGDLQDSGTSLTSTALLGTPTVSGDPVTSFPSGTLMLFQQTAAPTGWTKQTTHNDKALRVVSGAASSAGTVAFSTVFGLTATDSHTLLEAEIPAHTHTWTQRGDFNGSSTKAASGDNGGAGPTYTPATSSSGGGGGHSHNIDLQVQYVDLIIASKD
jgi:hypothetical protein